METIKCPQIVSLTAIYYSFVALCNMCKVAPADFAHGNYVLRTVDQIN